LRLNTLKTSRQSLAKIIKQYDAGELLSGKFRDLVHAFSVLLQYHKAQNEIDFAERLDRLERLVIERYDNEKPS
jgi:hypothetical protein